MSTQAVAALLGAFSIDASVDAEGHLTLVVKSRDTSSIVGAEVRHNQAEVEFLFSTEAIERANEDRHPR